MSSSMLEQAVIDAEALREAAIKNAEQEVLEKYSGDIREAVDSILEQEDEDLFGGEDEMGLGDEGDMEDHDSVVDQVSMAATDGENTCPCPDEGEPLVLDLDQIVAAAEDAAAEEEELDMGSEEPPAAEDELFEVNDQNLMQAIAEALSEAKDEDLSGEQKSEMDADDDGDIDEKDLAALRKSKKKEDKVDEGTKGYRKGDPTWGKPDKEDEDDPIDFEKKTKSGKREKIGGKVFEDSEGEETYHYGADEGEDEKRLRRGDMSRSHKDALEKDMAYDEEHEDRRERGTHFRESDEAELDEELLDEIVEALVVDLKNVPTGENFHTHPTMGQNERGLDIALAQEQDTKFAEEQKELRQALKKLQEQNKSQTLKMNKQKKEYKQLKSIALKATKKLEEVNFSNAKLIYTNRILKSDSLNERQKEKLVEAISKVGSVEEAKIVFDTLNENLTPKSNNAPKTLNEAVSKNSPLILKSNIEKQPAGQNQVDRLKRLAGIK